MSHKSPEVVLTNTAYRVQIPTRTVILCHVPVKQEIKNRKTVLFYDLIISNAVLIDSKITQRLEYTAPSTYPTKHSSTLADERTSREAALPLVQLISCANRYPVTIRIRA